MQFTLTSDEGLAVRGNLDVPGDAEALVIIIHGFESFKDWSFFPWLAEFLAGRRVAVCRFDMSRASVELADLRVVVAHAQEQVKLPSFLLGHASGGGIALLGAGNVSNLRGVITWSAMAHGAGIIDAASRLRVPLLAIHGERDDTVPPEESRALAAAAKESVQLIIRTASHTYNATHPLEEVPRELELAAAVTARFVAAYWDV